MRFDHAPRTRVAFTFVRPFLATSVLALAVTGCAPQSDEPTQQDYNDVATSVGALVAGGGGELASIEDSVGTATGEIPSGFTSNGSGQFEGTRGGLSFLYEVTCTGADGVTMAACDSTTDSASLLVEWSGNYDGDFWQFDVSRTGEWSVTGLQGDVAVFSGQGTFDVSSATQSLDGQRTRSFELSYAGAYDIHWDIAAERVIEGSIAYQVHAERHADGPNAEADAVFDIDAEITFDGTGTARLVLDGDRSYDLDLTTGAVSSR